MDTLKPRPQRHRYPRPDIHPVPKNADGLLTTYTTENVRFGPRRFDHLDIDHDPVLIGD